MNEEEHDADWWLKQFKPTPFLVELMEEYFRIICKRDPQNTIFTTRMVSREHELERERITRG